MDETLHNDDQLMRYLDGEMEAFEQKEFEALLEQDVVLKERLVQLQVAIEAIRQAGTVQKVRGIHIEMMPELRRGQKPVAGTLRRMSRVSLGLAASVVFLVVAVGGWQFFRLSPERVYEEHVVAYTVSATRGAGDASSPISRLYSRRAYTELIRASQNTSLSAQDSLLVGLAYLRAQQRPSAITWLQAVQDGGSQYRPDAEYYLALAYVRNKEYDKALALLASIHQNRNHLYHQQVPRSLLREVRLLKWK